MERTNTSNNNLPKEGHYAIAMLETVKKKKIKEVYTIYDFGFSTVLDGENYGFVISFFPSQMSELLVALGAKEIGKNDYEWDMEQVIGTNLAFTIVHQEDKKGNMRAVMVDVKPALDNGSVQPIKAKDVVWEE